MRLAVALLALVGCDRVFMLEDRRFDAAAAEDGTSGLCAGGAHFGNGGLFGVCLASAPADLRTIADDIVTGAFGPVDSHECDQLVEQADMTEVCVIAGRQIVIDTAIRATGFRPLVLVAVDELVVTATGSIDVSAVLGPPPAGSQPESCTIGNGAAGSIAAPHGAGGGGGTFAAPGGKGGTGSTGALGGEPSSVTGLELVTGGCDGGIGGLPYNGAGGEIGHRGNGGGAMYLIASSIRIAGTLNASGSGGRGGLVSMMSGNASGGGGGGSGGLIGLDATTITVALTAIVVANGGGGGGGGGSGSGNGNGGGTGGVATLSDAFPYVGGGGVGGIGGGGFGGQGGAAASLSGSDGGAGSGGGGGGGGGGAGHVLIYAAQRDVHPSARISPPYGP